MFNRLFAQIRRLPLSVQLLVIPLYFLFKIPLEIIGWATKEMASSAKAKAKKTFGPLLWPVTIVVGLGLALSFANPQAIRGVTEILLTLALMGFGVRVMFKGLPGSGKKKK